MNLIIFGGFLGSGKTSLILSLARYLVDKEKAEKPELVIIENEVGEVGIDDKVLETGGFEVKELFAGCVCCTLSASLTLTVRQVKENLDPKWVIIEATGLAYPENILSTILRHNREIIDKALIVTVVDAQRWEEFYAATPLLIQYQVEDGHVILLNKIDLVTPEEQKAVAEQVAKINPKAPIYPVSANKIDATLWEKVVAHHE